MLDGPDDDLRARGQVELAQDVTNVGLDGPLGHHERIRDLAIRAPTCHQSGNLTFTRRQPVDFGIDGWAN